MISIIKDIVDNKISEDSQIELLERFITENDDLEKLETILEKFNIFMALGIKNQEVRHSHFLAWILNPRENHGLGDYFLKLFLKQIAVNSKTGLQNISLFEIDNWDFNNTIVLKEWNNIDILLLNDELKFVCVIENKLDSREHSNQLTRYREIVEKEYFSYSRKLYLYLTIDGDRPEAEEVFFSLTHEQIGTAIKKLIENKSSQLNDEIRFFICHYLELIERYIMETSKVQEYCKLIYQKHQKALDIIYQHRPDEEMVIKEVILEILGTTTDIIEDHVSKSSIKFITGKLNFFPHKGDGWTSSRRILLFEIQNRETGVFIALYIGPGDQTIRNLLFETTKILGLKGASSKLNGKWNMITRVELAKPRDLAEKTRDEIKLKISSAISNFFSSEYPRILDVLSPLKNHPELSKVAV